MEAKQFRNIGYILHQLDDSDISYTASKIQKIQNDFDTHEAVNYQLIGQIEREYTLDNDPQCMQEFYKILVPLVDKFEESFGPLIKDKARVLNRNNVQLRLSSLWTNFQKKYEFNPAHNHNGVYSFVVWHKIPYDIEEEKQHSPGKNANKVLAGHFEFQFINSLGNIWQESMPVDKSWNNTICIFPAEMIHSVYPFYTSDDYRITISGNISIEETK